MYKTVFFCIAIFFFILTKHYLDNLSWLQMMFAISRTYQKWSTVIIDVNENIVFKLLQFNFTVRNMQVTISGAQEPSNANQYKKTSWFCKFKNSQDTKIYNLMKKQIKKQICNT